MLIYHLLINWFWSFFFLNISKKWPCCDFLQRKEAFIRFWKWKNTFWYLPGHSHKKMYEKSLIKSYLFSEKWWNEIKKSLQCRIWEFFLPGIPWKPTAANTLYTHSLLIHEEDTMVVSTSWRSSRFSCKPNTMLIWLNCWDLLLDIWEYTGTPPTGNWFFQWRRDPSKMSLTWYSWEKNALLQEVETTMVSSSWTSRECVYGLPQMQTCQLSQMVFFIGLRFYFMKCRK